jgi:hypothetical protein
MRVRRREGGGGGQEMRGGYDLGADVGEVKSFFKGCITSTNDQHFFILSSPVRSRSTWKGERRRGNCKPEKRIHRMWHKWRSLCLSNGEDEREVDTDQSS